jgi:hypothetical protein
MSEQILRHPVAVERVRKYRLTQKQLHQHPRNQIYSKQTQLGAPCDNEWFYNLGIRFWNNSLKNQISTYLKTVRCGSTVSVDEWA